MLAMSKIGSIFVLFLWTVDIIESANIVMFSAFGTPSHKFAFIPLANALVERGHNVTIISPFKEKKQTLYEDMMLPKVYEVMKGGLNINFFQNRLDGGIIEANTSPAQRAIPLCRAFLDSEEAADIITGKQKFDLIMIDALASECALGLAAINNAPIVYFCTADLSPTLIHPLGLPTNLIYIPFVVPFKNIADCDNVWDRVVFQIADLIVRPLRRYVMLPRLQVVWEKHLGRKLPSFEDLDLNISLILVNSHPTVTHPQPYLANIIDIGGIHITPPKPLNKELEDIVNGSGKDGFILCTFGSGALSKSMPKEYKQAFLDAFSQLKQSVIWKFETEDLQDIPANIFIQNWLPQNDLLSHDKCKGFITHGGKLGLLEAVNYAVPIIVVPLFADQEIHARFADKAGFGIYVEAADIITEKFPAALKAIVENPKYYQNVKQRSINFHDQPNTPLQRGIYWTEWVLRHPDISYLLPESRKWNWFSIHQVDVWIILVLLSSIPFVFIFLAIKLIYRCCYPKQTKNAKKEKGN